MTLRCRFAPSPTGHVHIGNMRAAIYNWLFARHHNGSFLLRIEDTDRERSTPEAVQTVLRAMDWLGLTVDEEPLYQSTRRDAHLEAAERLLAEGKAYKEDKGGTGRGEAVIFRMPGTDVTFRDEIKGELTKKAEDMKDLVIVRSDGNPVFHLANVVDDIHMGITHVIRGDDHIENTYRHVALYQALGAEAPAFAHLPMIVNAQGKPYSKRDGAAYVGDFRDNGYLPDALFNYLVLLGWSPGDDREKLTREEIVSLFDLDRVRSHAAQFDIGKFEWLNAEYMKDLDETMYRAELAHRLRGAGYDVNAEDPGLVRIVPLMRERIKKWSEAVDHCVYFFTEDFPFDDKAVRKRLLKDGAMTALAAIRSAFADAADFTAESLETALRETAEREGQNAGVYIHPVRVSVTGQAGGPSLFDLLEVLGRDRVLGRIDRALEHYG